MSAETPITAPDPIAADHDIEETNECVLTVKQENEQFEPPINEGDAVFVDIEVPQEEKTPRIQATNDTNNNLNIETPLLSGFDELQSQNYVQHYDIYDKGTSNLKTEDWELIPNDPSPFVKYWASPNSFAEYHTNSQENKQINSPFFAIGFVANLLIGFILMCCVTHNAKGKTSLSIFITFVVVLYALAVYLINHYVFPELFIKYGIWIALSVNFLCVFFLMFFRVYYWIGPFICMLLMAIVFFFAVRNKDAFNMMVFEFLNENIFKRYVSVVFYLVSIVLMAVIFVFVVYTSTGAAQSGWNNFVQFYLVISIWYETNVICNCLYMISASLLAKEYFTGSAPDFHDLLAATKRAFVNNLGVASKAALVLPISEWIRAIAFYDPAPFTDDLLHSSSLLAKAVKLARKVVSGCTHVSKQLDKLFTYPARKALSYCGMFGIDWKYGCLRYAEVCAKRKAYLVDLQYTGDTIWLYRCFVAEILICVVVLAFGPDMFGTGVSKGRGFFLSFMLFYTTRTILRATAETLFVCFGEDPKKADMIKNGLSKELSDAFVAADKAIDGVINTSALLATNNN
jgi:hypothetical protein